LEPGTKHTQVRKKEVKQNKAHLMFSPALFNRLVISPRRRRDASHTFKTIVQSASDYGNEHGRVVQ
jgi:hypothetical protein